MHHDYSTKFAERASIAQGDLNAKARQRLFWNRAPASWWPPTQPLGVVFDAHDPRAEALEQQLSQYLKPATSLKASLGR
ncbi:MAG: hypothetical protein U0894_00735 [Pirellulales bacterium]